MARNRAMNAGVAATDAAAQRSQESLYTNDENLGTAQKRTFPAELSTIEAIMADRRRGIDNPSGFSDYSSHIPYGPMLPGETAPLP